MFRLGSVGPYRNAAVHPGGIHTELGRYTDLSRMELMVKQINEQLASEGKPPFKWKTIPHGAATSVWAAIVAPADEVGFLRLDVVGGLL